MANTVSIIDPPAYGCVAKHNGVVDGNFSTDAGFKEKGILTVKVTITTSGGTVYHMSTNPPLQPTGGATANWSVPFGDLAGDLNSKVEAVLLDGTTPLATADPKKNVLLNDFCPVPHEDEDRPRTGAKTLTKLASIDGGINPHRVVGWDFDVTGIHHAFAIVEDSDHNIISVVSATRSGKEFSAVIPITNTPDLFKYYFLFLKANNQILTRTGPTPILS